LLNLKTGDLTNAGNGGDSGTITIASGSVAGAGTSGNVKIQTGTSGGTRGDIIFIDGTEGVTGDVWTSVNSSGAGSWATPPTRANITLSNLAATTEINSNLTFVTGAAKTIVIPQRVAAGAGDALTVQAGAANGSATIGGVLTLRSGQSTEGFAGGGFQVGAAMAFQSSTAPFGQAASTTLNPYTTLMVIVPTANNRVDITLGNTASDFVKFFLGDNTSGALLMQFKSPGFNSPTTITGTDRATSSGSGPLFTIAGGNALTSGTGSELRLSGGIAAGTNQNGGQATLRSGIATGNGGSSVVIQAVATNQGSGTTQRAATTVATFSGTLATISIPMQINGNITHNVAGTDWAISTANNGAGNSGNITIASGTATGTRGAATVDASAISLTSSAQQTYTSTAGNLTLSATSGQVIVDTDLVNITNSGVKTAKLVADPCGDTTNYPEATIFYNDTSDYYCFCNGANADVQMHSPATACF
jgi:hypothetical protein